MKSSKLSVSAELLESLPAEELRSRIWAAKEKRRVQMAGLPILEKFRIMDQMKEAADPIREYRRRLLE